MKLSELVGKEIVNIHNGARLGTVDDSDLLIEPETGEVDAIILPARTGINFWGEKHSTVIPWEAVKKIGSEVIIVEVDQAHSRGRRF